MKKILLYVTICIFTLTGCKKCKKEQCNDETNPSCPNYNPCWNKKPLKADFTIKEVIDDCDGNEYLHETDTIFTLNSAEFELSTPDVDSVKWYIGSEVLKQHKFRRSGFGAYNVQRSIKLVVYRNPTHCFPNDISKDSITKYIVNCDWDNEPTVPIVGLYLGYNTDNPTDTFRVWFGDTIVDQNVLPGFTYRHTYTINGLPRGFYDRRYQYAGLCNNLRVGGKFIDWSSVRKISMYYTNTYLSNNIRFGLMGKAIYNQGKISYDYYYCQASYDAYKTGQSFSGTNNWKHKVFIGKKIWPHH